MKYYNFSPSCSSKYVSAIAILNEDKIITSKCDCCGADELVLWNKFDLAFECETITSKRRLPDLMLYSGKILHSFNCWYIVSANFEKLCRDNLISGVTFTAIDLYYRKRGKLYKIEVPYFLMQIIGRAQLDYNKMKVSCSICPKCGHYIYDDYFPLYNPKGIYPTVLDTLTWDKSDIFNHGDCTENFMRKVYRSELCGIDFLPFEEKFDTIDNQHYIRK